MPIDIIDTVGNQIQILDDGTTITDIMYALDWVRKEKERQAGKHKKYYKPNGNPRGRPRKASPSPGDSPVHDSE